ncbi:MAG TPA: trehalose-6-phosphate synthase [Acidimicrobiales bacterium]|nr:trehalose-6-phosphate synthase [Acidimicrobiales bacterium]
MTRAPIVLVSNRGPLAFDLDGDDLEARRGAGGLISGLGPIVRDTDTLWISAAMSDADRVAAAGGVRVHEGIRSLLVDVDPATYAASYDLICNQILWFVHHGMFDRMRTPRFDRTTTEAWTDYQAVNAAFASAIVEHAPAGARVLVQDYHLALVAPTVRARRPDVRLAHFSHTPFATPAEFAVLPADMAAELLTGMAAHHVCGFHSERWRNAFVENCRTVLDVAPATIVAPLASDPDDIVGAASSPACRDALRSLNERVGDRTVLARVDRIEPSKNIVRGFEAFDLFLTEHPEWIDRVVFAASIYPSRQNLPIYQAYRQEVATRVALVNARHATDTWSPIDLDTQDHFPSSVALLRRADLLLVNPVRDGLNLVATEGALVNERNVVLLLSPDAGVFDTLSDVALAVPPFDVAATADAIHTTLELDAAERVSRFDALHRVARSRTPSDWLDDQLDALD